jgi:1,4-dihydroxy-2-naphthoyl-CoA synthase
MNYKPPTAIVGFNQPASGTTNTEENSMATMNAPTKPAQIRLTRRSHAYWRVSIDNPPINVMGSEMVKQFKEVINALEADEQVRVVVFDSAVDDYFLNHSDFMAKLDDLTSPPAGRTGLAPWPDFLVRLTRLPVASIALIRGRATGNGSEITLACDMSFASREKAIISQWEGGRGDGRRRRPHGSASRTHRSKPRPRGALEPGRHQSRPG